MADSNPIAAAPAAAPTARTVVVGGEPRIVERVSSAKAARMLAIVRAAGKAIPGILHKWGEFRTDYERTHSVELDRAQALAQYGPRPVLDDDGEPRRNADGAILMYPGPLAHLTEADWTAAGNVYRIPESPSFAETIPAVLPEVLDLAEEYVYKLLALVLMSNADVARAWRSGTLKDDLDNAVEELMVNSFPEELVEVAVVAGELVEQQYRSKSAELGDRLGNALRLFGLDPARMTSQTTDQAPQTTEEESTSLPTSSSPSSSTDSPVPTDGPSTPSSEPPSTSSTDSPTSNTPTENEPNTPTPTAMAATA